MSREPAHRSWIAVVLAAGLLVPAAPAAGLELFGIRLWGEPAVEEPEVFDPRPYLLELHVDDPDPDLAGRLRASSQLHAQQDRPPSGVSGLLTRARGDYGRILAALYRHARFGGTIDILVDGRPPEEIDPDAVLPDPVPVQVRIDPGPLFHFGQIVIESAPPYDRPETRRIDSPMEIGLVPGEIARSTLVIQAEASLVEAWRALGHPLARIAMRDLVADHRTRTLDVRLAADPGPSAVFGTVSVTGTDRMDPAFVGWLTGLAPGERYDPRAIEDAEQRLRRLTVFRTVAIEEAQALEPGGFLPLNVAVAERPPRVFGVGASLSTVDGASVEGYWTHRNLFGRAERLRLEAAVRRIRARDPRDFDYLASAHFTRPGTLTPDTDLIAELAARRHVVNAFEEESVAGRVGLHHTFTRELTGEAAVGLEYADIEDAFTRRQFVLLHLPAELAWDSRDDRLDPSEGVRAILFGEPFYDLRGDTGAVLLRGHVSAYQALDADGRFVLAGRLAAGSVAGAALPDIPSNRRFLAGGGGSIRGYRFQSVGVVLPTGETVGGRSLVEASAELRARVTDQIGLVPFVDVGTVGPDPVPDFSERVRVGVGVGLRYHTAVGPLRFDAAVPVNPRPGDPDFAIYIGIGQAF